MVQSTATVRFDKSDPTIFYYEPFQHNYEDTKITLRNLNITNKSRNILNLENEDDIIFKDSISELDIKSKKIEESGKIRSNVYLSNNNNNNGLNEEDTKIINSDSISGNSSILNNNSNTFSDADAEFTQQNQNNQQEIAVNGTKNTTNGENISNATYFYRILHHLIDIGSDGSRFKCCNRSPNKLCESCKVIDKLMFTYFDVTTMDDVIEERVKRGICGYLYCCNTITKSGSKSKYKIDIISKNIYKREEYESFCSVLCLEESDKVMKRVSQSPVETGAFTPRAMRCADNKTLKTLHDNVFSLSSCLSGSQDATSKTKVEQITFISSKQFDQLGLNQNQQTNAVDLGSIPPEIFEKLNAASEIGYIDDSDIEENKDNKEDKKQRKEIINTFEIYEDFESCDSVSESSISEVNVKFDKNAQNLKSIYKPCHIDKQNGYKKENKEEKERKINRENEDNIRYRDNIKEKTKEKLSFIDHECLGIFSLLWYVMSNIITNNTRDLVNSGIINKYEFREEFYPLYESCLKDLPNTLLPTLKRHIQHLLSTFKPVKENLLNDKVIQPLSYVIKYVILINRHHLPFSYNELSNQNNIGNGFITEKCGMVIGNVNDRNDDIERLDDIGNYDKDNEELKEINYQLLLEKIENILKNKYHLDQESLDILVELFVEL